MRLAGLRSLLCVAVALVVMGAFPGCENPLDPLNKSDKIQGLAFVDFAATWERWDADPEYDGIMVDMSYYNEFGDALAFHDKPHSIVIELWTQLDQNAGVEGATSFMVQDTLFYSKTVEFSNSEDSIRIPIEAYKNLIPLTAFDEASGEATGFMVVRIFPPQESPREELLVAQPDVPFFKPEAAQSTPNP